jgi:DNA-binding XRE family transcriptional regulator
MSDRLLVNFDNKITEKIKEFQKKYGSSRTFIANKMGISRQSLNQLENSENPTIIMLLKLAHVLECQVTDLYNVEILEQLSIFDDFDSECE